MTPIPPLNDAIAIVQVRHTRNVRFGQWMTHALSVPFHFGNTGSIPWLQRTWLVFRDEEPLHLPHLPDGTTARGPRRASAAAGQGRFLRTKSAGAPRGNPGAQQQGKTIAPSRGPQQPLRTLSARCRCRDPQRGLWHPTAPASGYLRA